MNIETAWIHFLRDVFAPSSSSLLKLMSFPRGTLTCVLTMLRRPMPQNTSLAPGSKCHGLWYQFHLWLLTPRIWKSVEKWDFIRSATLFIYKIFCTFIPFFTKLYYLPTFLERVWLPLTDRKIELFTQTLKILWLCVITFLFSTRWLRNFAKNNRYHSAIIWNISISLMVNIFCEMSAWKDPTFRRKSRLVKKFTDIFHRNFWYQFWFI